MEKSVPRLVDIDFVLQEYKNTDEYKLCLAAELFPKFYKHIKNNYRLVPIHSQAQPKEGELIELQSRFDQLEKTFREYLDFRTAYNTSESYKRKVQKMWLEKAGLDLIKQQP